MLLKNSQLKNKWLADYEAPHPLTQTYESWLRMPRLNKLSLVGRQFMRRRQANIDAFNGMSLCQKRYETRVYEHGEQTELGLIL